jgi:hypothetical protein
MHVDATASTLGLAQDANLVTASIVGVATKRILADQIQTQHQIQVCPRLPGRQLRFACVAKCQQYHAIRGFLAVVDDQLEVGRCRWIRVTQSVFPE